jgi:hypothetical protein
MPAAGKTRAARHAPDTKLASISSLPKGRRMAIRSTSTPPPSIWGFTYHDGPPLNHICLGASRALITPPFKLRWSAYSLFMVPSFGLYRWAYERRVYLAGLDAKYQLLFLGWPDCNFLSLLKRKRPHTSYSIRCLRVRIYWLSRHHRSSACSVRLRCANRGHETFTNLRRLKLVCNFTSTSGSGLLNFCLHTSWSTWRTTWHGFLLQLS